MSVAGDGFGMKGRSALLAAIALAGVLSLTHPARAEIDVTLDISHASEGPTLNQDAPQTPARTGFDPLPLGGIALLLIALGSLGLATQKTTGKNREGTS